MRALAFFLAAALAAPASALAGTTAWVSSNHIQVIDLDEGRVVGRLGLKEFIHDMEFSPNGQRVFVGSSKGFRVADATSMTFTQRLSERPTIAVSVSADGGRVLSLTSPDRDAVSAARKAGLPLPPATVTVFAGESLSQLGSFEVDGLARDLVVSADAATAYILEPKSGALRLFGLDGALKQTIQVVDQKGGEGHLDTMLGRMALSPKGDSLAIPVTNAASSAIAEVDLTGTKEDTVYLAGLGHARRIQGVAFDDDGSGVYVTAIASMVKFGGHGFPVAWKKYPVNFVDVAAVQGNDQTVMVTPTYNKVNKSGGVSLVDGNGEVVRTIELMDMSPFLVVVQPTP
jgi:hypothetical protein